VVSLRLATVNLFSGRSPADGRIDHDRVAAGIAELDADVLAVQEVDHHQPRSGGRDQAGLVARAMRADVHRFVPLVAGTPGVPGWVAAPRGPEEVHALVTGGTPSYGIALGSRRPVAGWHVLRLDPARGRWPIAVPSRPPRVLWLADEPRAVLAAELADPPMVVAGTHLSFVPGVNALQLRHARRWLTGLAAGRPLLLLGDLNLPGSLPARLTGWVPLATGRTFPAPAPRVQLDHALASGLPPGAMHRAAARLVDLPFGDHRAVVVDLSL
jgi:endonuclease/exonuclease/phosphatase family metal-dependent hydrolase